MIMQFERIFYDNVVLERLYRLRVLEVKQSQYLIDIVGPVWWISIFYHKRFGSTYILPKNNSLLKQNHLLNSFDYL